jgi:hypothetical protein
MATKKPEARTITQVQSVAIDAVMLEGDEQCRVRIHASHWACWLDVGTFDAKYEKSANAEKDVRVIGRALALRWLKSIGWDALPGAAGEHGGIRMTLTDRLHRFDQMARSARWPKALVNLGHWSVKRKDRDDQGVLGLANYEAALHVVSAGAWLSSAPDTSRGPWHGLAAWLLGKVGMYLLRTSYACDRPTNRYEPCNVGARFDKTAAALGEAARSGLPEMALRPQITDESPQMLQVVLATFTPEIRARALIVLGEGLAAADRLRRSLSVAGFLVLPEGYPGEGDKPA